MELVRHTLVILVILIVEMLLMSSIDLLTLKDLIDTIKNNALT